MPELPDTRHSLLLRLGERSDEAWLEFLTIYRRALLRYCRRRGLQDADAQDVTQDVLSAVDHRIGGSQRPWDPQPDRGSFRGWLFRVARNQVVDRLQQRARSGVASGETRVRDLLSSIPDRTDSVAEFEDDYRRELLHAAAERVRPQVATRSWQAFCRTAVEGQKPEAVAQSLGMTVGGVYTAKCRVFARIRQCVAAFDSDPLESNQGWMAQTASPTAGENRS